MEPLQPGHFWKTPFVWEPGGPVPPSAGPLRFVGAPEDWLLWAVGQVMADSLDESDQHAVATAGAAGAAAELLSFPPEVFEQPSGWWRAAEDAEGRKVGFVLPVLFKDRARWQAERPQGTIFYMGVLPGFRGRGYARLLVDEATRLFIASNCWRIFCDASSRNEPMLAALRQAGHLERKAWQRPVA